MFTQCFQDEAETLHLQMKAIMLERDGLVEEIRYMKDELCIKQVQEEPGLFLVSLLVERLSSLHIKPLIL